jgi:hypothetical protein
MSINFSDDQLATKFMEMVENVATIKERLEVLPELKKKVDRHETVYKVGKYAAVPTLGLLHIGFRQFFNKLGF